MDINGADSHLHPSIGVLLLHPWMFKSPMDIQSIHGCVTCKIHMRKSSGSDGEWKYFEAILSVYLSGSLDHIKCHKSPIHLIKYLENHDSFSRPAPETLAAADMISRQSRPVWCYHAATRAEHSFSFIRHGGDDGNVKGQLLEPRVRGSDGITAPEVKRGPI